MEKRRIVLIGSGNVATHLGRGLREHCTLVQVYSRTLGHATALAQELSVPSAVSHPDEVVADADVYIIAVSDDNIAAVAATLPDNDALWLHTAGSVGLDVLTAHHRQCGVLYPMQSFTRALPVQWSEVPIFVEGSDAATTAQVLDIAALLSQHVQQCDSRQRMAMHTAAVFACNFANHMWAESGAVLERYGVSPEVMLPLIRSTVAKLDHLCPLEAQTGPARRGDTAVMHKQMTLLDVATAELYDTVSQAIMRTHHVTPGCDDLMQRLAHIRAVAFDVDGVLSPSTITMHPSGEPMRMVNIKDGYALQLAAKLGIPLAIISGANVDAVRVRYEGLGLTDVFLGAGQKLPVFRQWIANRGLTIDEVAYVGDDIPDIPVMREAGLAVAPADACPEVRQAAHYIAPCRGGEGVARHLLEALMRAHNTWLHDEHAFGW